MSSNRKIIIVDGPVYDSINRNIIANVCDRLSSIIASSKQDNGIDTVGCVNNAFKLLMEKDTPLLKLSVEKTMENIDKILIQEAYNNNPMIIIGGYFSVMVEYIGKKFPLHAKDDLEEFTNIVKLLCDSFRPCFEKLNPNKNVILCQTAESMLETYFADIFNGERKETLLTGYLGDFINKKIHELSTIQIDIMNTIERVYPNHNIALIGGSGEPDVVATRIYDTINSLFK